MSLTRKARREAHRELIHVSNGYQRLLPYLAKFEAEIERDGKLSPESQALLQECVKSLHAVDRRAERILR